MWDEERISLHLWDKQLLNTPSTKGVKSRTHLAVVLEMQGHVIALRPCLDSSFPQVPDSCGKGGWREEKDWDGIRHLITDSILMEIMGLEAEIISSSSSIVRMGNQGPRVGYLCKVSQLVIDVRTLEWA